MRAIAYMYEDLHVNNLNVKEKCGEWQSLLSAIKSNSPYLSQKIRGYWITQLTLHDQFCWGDSTHLKESICNITEFMDEVSNSDQDEHDMKMLSDMIHRFMHSVRDMNLPMVVTVNNG